MQVACEGCGKTVSVSQDAPKLCTECAKKTGLAYPLPSRRGAWPCMRCGHRVLVRAQVRERSVDDGRDTASLVPAPLAITYARGQEFDPNAGVFSLAKRPSASPETSRSFGVLDAYVCRACGYVEWYAQEPENIPIGALYGTALVEIPGEGVYR